MSKNSKNSGISRVLVLRTRRCRKSDAVIRFLEKENIPHRVLHLEENAQAQALARRWNIKSSPGLIVGDQQVFATDILENCWIKNPAQTKEMFLNMLNESSHRGAEDTERQ